MNKQPSSLKIAWPKWLIKATRLVRYTRSDGTLVEYEREVGVKKNDASKKRRRKAKVEAPTLKNNPLSADMLKGDKSAFVSNVLEQTNGDVEQATALVNSAVDDFASDLTASVQARMGARRSASKDTQPKPKTKRAKPAKKEGFGSEDKQGFSGSARSQGFGSGGDSTSFEDVQENQDEARQQQEQQYQEQAAQIAQLALNGEVSLDDMARAISQAASSPEQAQRLVSSIAENMRNEMLARVTQAVEGPQEDESITPDDDTITNLESQLDAAETQNTPQAERVAPTLNEGGKFDLPLGISQETANETIAIVDSIMGSASQALAGTLTDEDRETLVQDLVDTRALLFELDGMTPNNVLGAVEASDLDERMKQVASELLGTTENMEGFLAVADHLLETLELALDGTGDPETMQATVNDIRELARAFDNDGALPSLEAATDDAQPSEDELLELREAYDQVLADEAIVSEIVDTNLAEYMDITGADGRDASSLALVLKRWNGPGPVFERGQDGRRRVHRRIRNVDMQNPLVAQYLDRDAVEEGINLGQVEVENVSQADAEDIRKRKGRERREARKNQQGDTTTQNDEPTNKVDIEQIVQERLVEGSYSVRLQNQQEKVPEPTTPRDTVRSQVDFAPSDQVEPLQSVASELDALMGDDSGSQIMQAALEQHRGRPQTQWCDCCQDATDGHRREGC